MSLPQIDAVFVWVGGVLVEDLAAALAEALTGSPIASANIHIRQQFRQLVDALALGRIDPLTFCRSSLEAAQAAVDADDLAARLRARAQLNTGVVAMLEDLPPQIEKWVVCDYPRAWAASVLRAEALPGDVPPARIVFLAEQGLQRLMPDVIYLLAHQAGRPVARCLLIDAATPRAVEAIQHGMQATIFVDERRLRRDLVLRRLLPPPAGFVFPGDALPGRARKG